VIFKRAFIRGAITALVWIVIGAGIAHAHGGMAGPDELGPPLGISVGIGLACYWLIVLWPSRPDEESRRSSSKMTGRTAK
jgi:hypothetical protein